MDYTTVQMHGVLDNKFIEPECLKHVFIMVFTELNQTPILFFL